MKAAQRDSTKACPGDGWTSTPLTLWLMDIETHGYAFQEGEAKLLAGALSERLTTANRMHLVERAILPALLEELKLGSSRLSDPATALSLGRLMAARLILAGRLSFSGPQGQVALRLIETESGTIKASLTESFGLSMPASALAEKLSSDLLEQMAKVYPLRGKVMDVQGNRVRLNIGQTVGVKEGDLFRLESSETIHEGCPDGSGNISWGNCQRRHHSGERSSRGAGEADLIRSSRKERKKMIFLG